MSNKSKFLKSATLAIAGVVLASGLSSCKMMHHKKCAPKEEAAKEEKAKCSSTKENKASCSSKAKEGKTKSPAKKAKKAE